MKNRRWPAVGLIITTVFCLLFLPQCELFLGESEHANVGIDLSDLYGATSRAIANTPQGITIAGVRVSVFASDMQRMEKWITAGTRFVNMYVPAGEDRRFTLEVFFTFDPQLFPYTDLRSFKGRAVADLRPGMFVGLKFQMAAGQTTLLVQDYSRGRIFQSDSIDFGADPNQGTLGLAAASLSPNDIDVDAAGRIFASNAPNNLVNYADTFIGGGNGGIAVTSPTALAVDRDLRDPVDLDDNLVYDSCILYVASGSNIIAFVLEDRNGIIAGPPPQMLTTPNQGTITGMSVDPWTHRIFVTTNAVGNPNLSFLFKYDPFATGGRSPGALDGDPVQLPDFRSLQDVIVKDDGVFVLNQVLYSDTAFPIVMKFDHALNYQGGFGTISSQFNTGTGGWEGAPSVAPGNFYHPKRFFAQENDGLYIIDDSNLSDNFNGDYDKLVVIGTNLDPASWQTFPLSQTAGDPSPEPFRFFE